MLGAFIPRLLALFLLLPPLRLFLRVRLRRFIPVRPVLPLACLRRPGLIILLFLTGLLLLLTALLIPLALLILPLPGLLSFLVLLLLLLPFQFLFQQLPVEFRVGMIRPLGQGPVIGGNCLVVAPQARQRVSPVVIAFRIGKRFQAVQGAPVIPGAVLRRGFPGGVVEQFGRRRVIPGIHCPLPLLVPAQPQVIPVQRSHRFRLGEQEQRQCQHITATEQQRNQGQQAQYQPGALLTPDVSGDFGARLFADGLRFGEEPGQLPGILIVFGETHINTAAGAGEPAQCAFIQDGNHYLAVPVLQETAIGQQHRCAVARPHAQYRQAVTLVSQ